MRGHPKDDPLPIIRLRGRLIYPGEQDYEEAYAQAQKCLRIEPDPWKDLMSPRPLKEGCPVCGDPDCEELK